MLLNTYNAICIQKKNNHNTVFPQNNNVSLERG